MAEAIDLLFQGGGGFVRWLSGDDFIDLCVIAGLASPLLAQYFGLLVLQRLEEAGQALPAGQRLLKFRFKPEGFEAVLLPRKDHPGGILCPLTGVKDDFVVLKKCLEVVGGTDRECLAQYGLEMGLGGVCLGSHPGFCGIGERRWCLRWDHRLVGTAVLDPGSGQLRVTATLVGFEFTLDGLELRLGKPELFGLADAIGRDQEVEMEVVAVVMGNGDPQSLGGTAV